MRSEGRMKKRGQRRLRRKLGGAAVTVMSACLLTGCRLALEEAPLQDQGEDMLVGVFVTEEYLSVGIPEPVIGADGEVSFAENEERIPGTLVFDGEVPNRVVFDGIEGCGIYSLQLWDEDLQINTSSFVADDIFSDVSLASGDRESLEATIYVGLDGPGSFYSNPVYQTPEGDVYMQPGTGLTLTGSDTRTDGASMSQKLSWERKVEQDGQETVTGASFTIHITFVDRSAACRILLMDEDNGIAGVMTGEELGWELKVPAEAAYLILEQEKSNGDIVRSVRSRGEESLELMRSLGNGFLTKQEITLVWE